MGDMGNGTRYQMVCKPKFDKMEKLVILINKKMTKMQKTIEENNIDTIIKTSLEESMTRLNGDLAGHIKEHKEYIAEKRQGKRKFWFTLLAGTITGLIITVATIVLTNLL